jgi:hypothetical protein
MANAYPTLLDVVKLNKNPAEPIVNEVITQYKELGLFPASSLRGSQYHATIRTGNPSVAFRYANDGAETVKALWETRTFETALIDTPVAVDRDGVFALVEDKAAFLRESTVPVMDSQMQSISRQIWYGGSTASTADAKAFPGLIAQYNSDSAHVVDAGGTTASTGSSVWFLGLRPTDIEIKLTEGYSFSMGDSWTEVPNWAGTTGTYTAMFNRIVTRPGFVLKNKNAAVRIKKLTADSGKTLTDAKMFSAQQLCDELNFTPTHIFMTPRSLYQLQASRTATTTTGVPAPLPTDWNGIPIIITINLLNTEALTL